MQRVLILGEYRTNSSKAYDIIPLIFSDVLTDDKGNKFDNYRFEYLVDEPIHENDFEPITDPQFKKALNLKRLETILNEYQPTRIITLGSRACKLLTGEKTITHVVGKNLETSLYKCEVFPNYSPIFVENNKAFMTKFLEVFDNVFNEIDTIVTEYKIIESVEEFKHVLDWCRQEEIFVHDYETNGLEWFKDEILPTVLSISFNPGFSYVLPLFHDEWEWTFEDIQEILKLLKEILLDENVTKVGHNIKFDLHFSYKICDLTEIRGRVVDTMLMHHLLDENAKHGLKEISKELFPYTEGYEIKNFATASLEKLCRYAAVDTDNTFKIFVHFENQLIEDDPESTLYVLLRNLSMPSLDTFLNAEHHGALIDRQTIIKSIEIAESVLDRLNNTLRSFKEVSRLESVIKEEKLNASIKELEEKYANAKGHWKQKYELKLSQARAGQFPIDFTINFNSSQQLTRVIFDKEGFGIPLFKDEWTGELIKTTDKDYLKTIKDKYPFIENLLYYRSVSKMISTYYKGILERLDRNDYLHSSFLLHGTTTGRIASRDPNLQNIPSRIPMNTPDDVVETFKMVKKFFIPPPGYTLVQCDYSQAELRTIANFSDDPTMIEAYRLGKDLHTITGARILNMTVEEFMKIDKAIFKDTRILAKGANFGYVFAATIKTYIETLKKDGKIIDEKTAKIHRDAIFDTYPMLTVWHETYKAKGRKFGYVRTLFGRKRRVLNINNESSKKLREADERLCINNPIQGTSGEWTLFAAAVLKKILPKHIIFFNNIHDAIYFYIPTNEVEFYLPIISKISAMPPIKTYFGIEEPKVPMKLDFEISKDNWGSVKEYII